MGASKTPYIDKYLRGDANVLGPELSVTERYMRAMGILYGLRAGVRFLMPEGATDVSGTLTGSGWAIPTNAMQLLPDNVPGGKAVNIGWDLARNLLDSSTVGPTGIPSGLGILQDTVTGQAYLPAALRPKTDTGQAPSNVNVEVWDVMAATVTTIALIEAAGGADAVKGALGVLTKAIP